MHYEKWILGTQFSLVDNICVYLILGTNYNNSDKYSECFSIGIKSYMIEVYLDKRLFKSFKDVQIYLTLNLHT